MRKLLDYISTRPVFYFAANTPPILRTSEPETPPAPAPPRVSGSGYLECDFCHCKLTKIGEVYQVSDQAREFRDEKETHRKAVAKLDEEIVNLRSQLSAKDAEIAALKNSSGGTSQRSKFL